MHLFLRTSQSALTSCCVSSRARHLCAFSDLTGLCDRLLGSRRRAHTRNTVDMVAERAMVGRLARLFAGKVAETDDVDTKYDENEDETTAKDA